jgi:signal transduction histidine kinase
VCADAGRIEQVVTNYLTNALKYSQEDRPVAVGLQVGGDAARLWVRDQGVGVPVADQASIWERFHRAAGVTVQSGSDVGIGLGLHISKTIVEQHGGAVGVESTPSQGSTFWFTLPLATSGSGDDTSSKPTS